MVELGAGLALASAANAPGVLKNIQQADFTGAFNTLSNAFTNKSNQQKMVGIGISAVLQRPPQKALESGELGK